jgi:hypothetical protein
MRVWYYRLSNDGEFYLLEANPNPQIARNEDFADSAAHCGLSYCRYSKKNSHPWAQLHGLHRTAELTSTGKHLAADYTDYAD